MKNRLFILGGLVLFAGILAAVCFAAEGDERFFGGSGEGYDLCSKTNTTLQSGIPSGTMLSVR